MSAIKIKRDEDSLAPDDAPATKYRKCSSVERLAYTPIKLNHKFFNDIFRASMARCWQASEADQVVDTDSGVLVYQKPFQIGLLPQLLESPDVTRSLVDEIVNEVCLAHMRMDLYEFHRSSDLSKLTECALLTAFMDLLRHDVRPWLEQVTQLKLDYVSASCSMFTCGDFLLPHDDLLNDRQIAFIYYLTPWTGVEEWRPEQGGCLEILNSDDKGYPLFPAQRVIAPKNNQLLFFKVGKRSFHQVGEVKTFDYPRLTINGWFHGAVNEEMPHTQTRTIDPDFRQPVLSGMPNLDAYIKSTYLQPDTAAEIQERVENASEICLYNFLELDFFEQLREQLLNDSSLRWRRQGPPNLRNYETLELNSATGSISTIIALFRGNPMFALISDYTDLDLSGPDAVTPTCKVELQRWSHGDYTILNDESVGETAALDVTYFINAADGSAVFNYLVQEEAGDKKELPDTTTESETVAGDTDEDDEDPTAAILNVPPVDNALNLVYRLEDTTKFVKYINHRVPMDKGPVFVLNCTYRE